MLKVTTEEKYQYICENFTQSEIVVEPGDEIEVSDISSYRTRVKVNDVPFELDDNTLKVILNHYGKVEKVLTQYNHKLKASKSEKARTDRKIV